jgi:hypothetical protein
MHSNSRHIESTQPSIHGQLPVQVARHAATEFQKLLPPSNRAASEASLQAFESDGGEPLIPDSGCGIGLPTPCLMTIGRD